MVAVHIVYYTEQEQIYSTGINVEGKSFADCCLKFESMKIGVIHSVIIKE
jgi:hypothetical protein